MFISTGAGITVVIMAGGRAQRLEGHNTVRDKTMVRVEGAEPFIDYIVHHHLREATVEKVVIATVGRSDIVAHFAKTDPRIVVCDEAEAHGTGGDLVRAVQRHARTPDVLAVNGDTVLSLDVAAFLSAHHRGGKSCTAALTSQAGLGVQNVGAFMVDRDMTILHTAEADPDLRTALPTGVRTKSYSATGAILYRTDALLRLPLTHNKILSAERQLVPSFVAARDAFAFDNDLRPMLDNGTPERMRAFLAAGRRMLLSIYGPPERI